MKPALSTVELQKYFKLKPKTIAGAIDIMKVIFAEGALDNFEEDEGAVPVKDTVSLEFNHLYQLLELIKKYKGKAIPFPFTIRETEIKSDQDFKIFIGKVLAQLTSDGLDAYYKELEQRKTTLAEKFEAPKIELNLKAGEGIKGIENGHYRLDELIGALLVAVLNPEFTALAPAPVKPKTMIIPFFNSFKTNKGSLQLVFDYENGQAIAANAYNALREVEGIYAQGKIVVSCEGNTLTFLPAARGAAAGCVDKFLNLYEVKLNTQIKFAEFRKAIQKPADSLLEKMHKALLIDHIQFKRQIEEKVPSNPVKLPVGRPLPATLPPLPPPPSVDVKAMVKIYAIFGGKAPGVAPPSVHQVAPPVKPPVAIPVPLAPIKKSEEVKDKDKIQVTFPKHITFGNFGIAFRFDNEEIAETVRCSLRSKEAKQEGDQLILSYNACQNGFPWLAELICVYQYQPSLPKESLEFLNLIIKTFISEYEGKFATLENQQLQATTLSAQQPWKILHAAHMPFTTWSLASRKSLVNPDKISFVTKGDFKNSAAILSFGTKEEAKAALKTLISRYHLKPDPKLVYVNPYQAEIIFTPIGCKEGYVGKLLSLFEYPDQDTLDAASFLVKEVAKGEELFGGSRASRCNSALLRVLKQSKYIDIGVAPTQFAAQPQYTP